MSDSKKLYASLSAIHSALDDALGDSDVTHIDDDDELRSEHPTQWAAQKLAEVIAALHSDAVADGARVALAQSALEAAAARFNLMAGVGHINGADPKVGYRECMEAIAALRSAPVKASSIRDAALEEAAQIAENGCLVPPDGGSPTEDEREMCESIASSIRVRKLFPRDEAAPVKAVGSEALREALEELQILVSEYDTSNSDWQFRKHVILKVISAALAHPGSGDAEPGAWDTPPLNDLPLYWRGWANSLRLMDATRSQSDEATLAQAAAFEECAKELKAALATPQAPAQTEGEA